jgi:hypothetical protein
MRPANTRGSGRPADRVVGRVCCHRRVRRGICRGWTLAEGPLRPVDVAVIDVFAVGVVEMPSAGDEDSVSALAPGTGDPPFADRVRPRHLDRRGDDPHAGRSEDSPACSSPSPPSAYRTRPTGSDGPTGVAATKPDPEPATTAVRPPTLPERTRSREHEVPGRDPRHGNERVSHTTSPLSSVET